MYMYIHSTCTHYDNYKYTCTCIMNEVFNLFLLLYAYILYYTVHVHVAHFLLHNVRLLTVHLY